MQYELIATDFDDTFLSTKGEITDRAKKAVEDFQRLGGKFMLCSGRMFRSIQAVARELGLHGDVICYNGAMIGDIDTGEIKYHNTLDLSIAAELIRELESENRLVHLYIEDDLYIKEKNEYSDNYCKICRVSSTVVGYSLADFLEEKGVAPTKVLLVDSPENVTAMYQKYSKICENKYAVTPSASFLLDFVSPTASKGDGVRAMCDKYGVDYAKSVCFGDSPNDISMLKFAGLGVAVRNARDSVIEVADYVTKSCDEDGVAEVIEKIIRGEIINGKR